MSSQGKGFFKGGDLQLKREGNKVRNERAKEANKGFCGQIRRSDEARHKKHQADQKLFRETQYKGQDTLERVKEISAPEKNQDPSQAESTSGDTGFTHQVNWNSNNPRNR